jgi:hypothetical protein
MKENSVEQYFDNFDKLSVTPKRVLSGVSANVLHTVFQEWVWRLQLCCESNAEYIEWHINTIES